MKKVKLTIVLLFVLNLTTTVISQNNNLDFAGDDDYVNITLNTNGWTGLTIEAWVYLRSYNLISPDAYISNIAGHDDASSLLRIGDYDASELISDKIPQFVITTSNGNKKCSASTELNLDTWYHIAGTYDGSNIKIFVNGILENTVAYTGNILTTNTVVLLGGSATDRYFDGLLDEVRIWNDGRTQLEIRQNMYQEISPPDTDLVAYYKLNETSGTTATDTKGSYDGTLTNMTGTWGTSSAMFGPKNCLDFDGADDNVNCGDIDAIDGLSAITISAWIKWEGGSSSTNIASISRKEYVYAFGAGWGASGKAYFFIDPSGSGTNWLNTGPSATTVYDGSWHHIAGVYDNPNLILYVDGVQEAINNIGSVSLGSTTSDVIIGRAAIISEQWNGLIDELTIWSDVRTEQEIREDMCKTLTGNETNLVAYYNFDNATGSTLQDLSANANDGTVSGAGWTISSAYNTWLNTTNNAWRTISNWSRGDYGKNTDNVGIYGYGGNSVAPSYSYALDVRSLVIGSNGEIDYGNVLNVYKNCIINSDFDVPDGSSIEVFGNMVISSSKTLDILEGGFVTIANDLYNQGSITIQSNASATGSIIINGSLTDASGTFTTERYIAQWTDANHGWHFISSPVASQAIQPGFVSDPPASTEDLYSWDEVNNEWINTKAGGGAWNSEFESTFTVGKGYLIAYGSDQTKVFSGAYNGLDVNINGLTYTIASDHSGWNLLGNPFPSGVMWKWDIEGGGDWAQTYVGGTAKIWDESAASYTDITNNDIIPAMQGFMVYVQENQTGSLTIPKSQRSHETDTWFKSEEPNVIKLIAHDNEGQTSQESTVRFIPEATEDFDMAYDSYFLSGYAPLFYTQIQGKSVSTNTFPELQEDMAIPLYFIKNNASSFTIEVEGINNLSSSYPVFLTDLKTNNTQNLSVNPVYSFTSLESDNPQRFLLHFKAVGIEEEYSSDNNIIVWYQYQNLHINNPESLNGEIRIYNMHGQAVEQAKLNGFTNQQLSLNVPTGYYVVNIITDGQIINKKVYLK